MFDSSLRSTIPSIFLFPEVCLTGFDYENIEKAIEFTANAIELLLSKTKNRTIVFTAFNKVNKQIYNTVYVIHNRKIVHKQSKVKLFKLGNEDKYFTSGHSEEIVCFTIDNISFAVLVCFELRFKELWKKIEGSDIILIPAQWGKIRSEHFKILTQSLAVMNQCYVMACDANNSDTTGINIITTPFGITHQNNTIFEKSEIKKMRRYLDVGIKFKEINDAK